MLTRFSLFFSALGLIFAFLIYTNSFLNPEVACALGAGNCVILALKPIFRNLSLFLTLGLFLSFIANFAKFFAEKEGFKIAVVANLIFNLLTFLVVGILLITSITQAETKNSINILSIIIWVSVFINIVISLFELKPAVSQSHTQSQEGYGFVFSVLIFLLFSSLGSLVFSNSFLTRKNLHLVEELSSLPAKEQSAYNVDFTPLLAGLDQLREDLNSNTLNGIGVDYSKLESVMKNAIVSAFGDIMKQQQQGKKEYPPIEIGLNELNIEKDRFLGPANAPVTIVEFGSFTCPHCLRLHPVVKDVLKKYPEKVKFVYKHFPVHGDIDVKLAELIESAGDQGEEKYWEFYDKLADISIIRSIMNENGELNKEKVLEIVKSIGLNSDQFQEAIDKRIHKDKIEAHAETIQKIFVDAIKKFKADPNEYGPYTPLIFINGKEYKGARSVDALSKVIDEEIKKAEGKK